MRTPPFKAPGHAATADRVWHDTAEGALAAAGLSVCETKAGWLLQRAAPGRAELWPPGTPAPLVAEAADLAGLTLAAPALLGPAVTLAPVAGFKGRQWVTRSDGVTLTALDGVVHGVADSAPACRAVLHGPPGAVAAMADQLAAAVPLAPPRWSLATAALAVARGRAAPDRHTGAPAIPQGMVLDDAIALVVGHLTDVLLAVADQAAAGRTPAGVHQMRVAVRRLRSALSVFKHATGSATVAALAPGLVRLGQVLGEARDWDVFLGGAGPEVAAAMDDPRIGAMLAAAARRRQAGYAALRAWLSGPEHRALLLALAQAAALRPWRRQDDDQQAAVLAAPAADYAAVELKRRHHHMLKSGRDLATLPIEALHDLRKQGKRLRYAAEFFTPLLHHRTSREFVARLADLQEALGHLNDTATAARLMGALGRGAGQQFAAGAVQGYTAAKAGDTRAAIGHAWRKFRKVDLW